MTGEKSSKKDEMPPEGGARGLPAPSFSLLAVGIAAQCQVALGLRPNPVTNETKKDLAAARHAIGMLEMLDAKTKGNLDDSERRLMSAILADLRMAFVKASR